MLNRIVILRGKDKGYVDFNALSVPKMFYSLVCTVATSVLILLPFSAIGALSVDRESGAQTSVIYLVSVVASTLAAYLTTVPAVLNGFMFTQAGLAYPWTGVVTLVRRNWQRIVLGASKAVFLPLLFVCAYWFLLPRVGIIIPPVGLWLSNIIIASTVAISDGYRIYRDKMTVLDSFGAIEPRAVTKSRVSPVFRVPLTVFGDGVLVFPLIHAIFIAFAAVYLLAGINDPAAGAQGFPLLYLLAHAVMQCLWAIGYRVFDAFKPWGERGKLSAVRTPDGQRIETN